MKEDITLEDAKKIRRQFRILALIAIATVIVGTFGMMKLENLSFVDGFYFSIIALTTVGFGDITPATDTGKIFVAFYLLVGIAIIAAFINNLLRNALAKRVIKKSERNK